MRYFAFGPESDDPELKAQLWDFTLAEFLMNKLDFMIYDYIDDIWFDKKGIMRDAPANSAELEALLPREYRNYFNDYNDFGREDIYDDADELDDCYKMFKNK